MKVFIQRVLNASVRVGGECIGKIEKGYLIFLGVGEGDTRAIADKMFDKMLKLRIFQDENGKTNRSIRDVEGEILIVSQFTLYADCRKGNRPNFTGAGNPEVANELYEYFIQLAYKEFGTVQTGMFGADMKVSLINDGPFTILLDSKEICK